MLFQSVRDTGTGMTVAVKLRIFDPFFTTKGLGKGTGLGLSIVFGIVKQSGGYIDVQTGVDLGTAFDIYFPATEGEPPAPTRPALAPTARQGTERVVLVEDELAVRTIALAVLDRAGYAVRAVATAEEALALGPDERIDMLVTDVVLPGLDGRQLAARLVQRRPALRVLFTSGYTGTALLDRKGLDPGEAFLEKPYTPLQLLRRVREVLDGSR